MLTRSCCCLLAAMAVTAVPAQAQYEWTSSRPDGHAPIAVLGDHPHSQGEYMLSYRFMRMLMAGNRDGTNDQTASDVLENFMVAPLDMTMTMHMVGLMYAPSDRVTLMAMGNWTDVSMNLRAGGMGMGDMGGMGGGMGGVNPTNFGTASSGLGDAGLGALIGLKNSGSTRVHLNAGVSLPVGSIERVGVTPMSQGNPVQLPYPMQLGSGTWDVRPGITVLGMTSERWSWGLQAKGRLRLGENSRSYRRGHAGMGTAWFGFKASNVFSFSARAEMRVWGNYAGHDSAYGMGGMNDMGGGMMSPMCDRMAPTMCENLRGGRRLDVPLGMNVYIRNGPLAGHRIAAEWHMPVYQSLNGPQLRTDWILTVGWQKAFDFGAHAH